MEYSKFKLGSLFDGSGGFPLAASLCGIEPVCASEVEPYPIAVTRSRFPNMKHLGDISKINGAEIEPVDVVSFGSPCQDLSVAGLRKGLKHEDNGDEETTRSGLFMEAIRIIKEMREATNGRYPTFAVWENVPGAFSSNKGEDFRVVLEELIKIAEPSAVMPAVPQKGWAYADYYCGDGWSIAYRVLDAQYIRTAQRRRRIYLVLDLGGQRSRKILFEREGLRGYPPQSGTQRQATPADAQGSIGADDRARECVGFDVYNQATTGEKAKSLTAVKSDADHVPVVVYDARGNGDGKTVGTITGDHENRVTDYTSVVCESVGFDTYNMQPTGDKTVTLRAGSEHNYAPVFVPYTLEPGIAAREGGHIYEGVSGTLRANAGDNQMSVAFGICSYDSNAMKSPNPHSGFYEASTSRTLDNNGGNPCCNQGGIAIVEPVPYTLKIRSGCEGGGKGALIQKDKSATLATNNDQYLFAPVEEPITVHGENKVGTLLARDFKGAGRWDSLNKVVAIDRAFYNQGQNALYEPQTYEDGTCPTLVAKGPGTDCTREKVRYIVRRLTPTECARLQGFPDKWGHPDHKTDFTDEEYQFWLDVRNTHAEINGKAVKEYTKEQMVKWYNKLHTDSSEYKMWGNGIALPCALYVMQGIEDALKGE